MQKCRGWTADLQLRARVSTALTVSLGGERGHRGTGVNASWSHRPLLDTFSLLVSHRRCVHTRKSPPLTQKLVSTDFFPETHRNKRSTKPWSLGHQAEDTALQISTRQEAQNGKGNHVPFKGILIVFSFNIDVPYTSSNVRVPLSRRTGRALYITKALGGSRF